MLINKYFNIEPKAQCLDQVLYFLFRNLDKVQVKVVFQLIRFEEDVSRILLSESLKI